MHTYAGRHVNEAMPLKILPGASHATMPPLAFRSRSTPDPYKNKQVLRNHNHTLCTNLYIIIKKQTKSENNKTLNSPISYGILLIHACLFYFTLFFMITTVHFHRKMTLACNFLGLMLCFQWINMGCDAFMSFNR